MKNWSKIVVGIIAMSLLVQGCKSDALMQVTTLKVSLPEEATAQTGWSLVQVSVTQDGFTETTTLTEQTTTLTVPINKSTEVSVSTVAAQISAGSSVGWYTSTQAFDPLGGINTLEIQNTASPQQAANFEPQLYHAEAQSNVAWGRELAILFIDLATGFTTSPVFKTNQDLTMPVGVNWVAVFVDAGYYGSQIDTYSSNINEIIAYHNSIVSNSEGLVFFDHDEGLVLNSSGGVSMDVQGLVGYDADSHSGRVALVVAKAPSLSTDIQENTSSSTDTVEEGSIVLTEIAGFPETDPAFSIECAASASCSTETGWQSCNQPFDVNQSTIFMVRYDEIPTLGCLSFEIRMDTDADLSDDSDPTDASDPSDASDSSDPSDPPYPDENCSDGRWCTDGQVCECTGECASSACGTPGCGSCGTCSAGEYCGVDAGGFGCKPSCSAMNQQVPVTNKGACLNGRFVAACYQGEVEQWQCYPPEGLESSDYICDTTTDGYAVCVDTRDACSPNCNELMLGEYDGCGQLCGAYYNGESLPCGDSAPLTCDPELPQIDCVDGSWSITPN